jgi:hypothetical protein
VKPSFIWKLIAPLEAYRAAERVETEGRIVGPDVGAPDGNVWDEIPVDGIAEGFIDANALHVDRKPLRGALQRRGREAAIAQIRGELVALDVANEHARQCGRRATHADVWHCNLFLAMSRAGRRASKGGALMCGSRAMGIRDKPNAWIPLQHGFAERLVGSRLLTQNRRVHFFTPSGPNCLR